MNNIKRTTLYLLMTLCVLSCQAKTPVKIYVSSSSGNDRNSGLSLSSPMKTLNNALNKGDEIYLKCGDVFYEHVNNMKGKKITSYGNGARPVICGYKRIIKPKWKKSGKNVWKTNLSVPNFTGYDTKGSSTLNNIGCIHEYDKDLVHGRKVEKRSDLRNDWDIWQASPFSKDTSAKSFDELYLFSKTNPNKLCLEFSVGAIGVIVVDATLENVEIRGFGCHGIVAQSNAIIRNCRIDAIGGMAPTGATPFVCYGNGIEFWVDAHPVENSLVERTHISRCYDCGMTIQGNAKTTLVPKNILIQNNLITECCQGWEDFLNNGKQYINCRLKNNIIANCGNTSGFGYPDKRFVFCNVLGHNHNVRNGMIIEGNTFIGGNFYSASPSYGDYQSNVWIGNHFITSRGHWLVGFYTGTRDVIYIPKERGKHKSIEEATDAAIRQYRQMTGDKTTNIEIKSENEVQSLIKQYKANFK